MKYRKHRFINSVLPNSIVSTFLSRRRYFIKPMLNYKIRVGIDYKHTKQRLIHDYKRIFREAKKFWGDDVY